MDRASRYLAGRAWWVAPAANVAGLLWGTQGAIWVFAPKVQEAMPPYAITDRPLFAAVWLSIVGAVFCSASALRGLGGRERRANTIAGRVGGIAALLAAALGAIGGGATVLAAFGVAEGAMIATLSLALDTGGLFLLAAASLVGIAVLRDGSLPGRSRYLPLVLATLTLLTLGAIAANGSRAIAGLVLAVAIVTASGATWLALGRALGKRSRSV